jgi:hypothetical protein
MWCVCVCVWYEHLYRTMLPWCSITPSMTSFPSSESHHTYAYVGVGVYVCSFGVYKLCVYRFCTCACVWMFMYAHMCVCVCMQMHIHLDTYTLTLTHTHACIQGICIPRTNTCIPAYLYTHINIHKTHTGKIEKKDESGW